MYEIYLNRHLLRLAASPPETRSDWNLVSRYRGRPKTLYPVLDALEKRTGEESVCLVTDDLPKLWQDFQSICIGVQAAGGLVTRRGGEILVIYRNGVFDLPKGKVEESEPIPIAALREVEEETGLSCTLRRESPWAITWHAYRQNKKRYLKRTDWFAMKGQHGEIRPQGEEGIEKVLWMTPEDYLSSDLNTYRGLRDMLKRHPLDPILFE